ncbi:ankyrin repeat domain-containing protein 50 [Coprinopsis cinerea AmutBmut pab1-1]|nr:ankyrin repeat domain-containing protein 50 [Coprinopsis cinerea AmutBmut pab1-1]
MTIPMLQHALAMREGLFDPDSIVTQGGTIVEVCHGLIMVDDASEGQIVKLVHQTVRDTFSELLPIAEAKRHLQIANACVGYLQHAGFESLTRGSKMSRCRKSHQPYDPSSKRITCWENFSEFLHQPGYPFLSYAFSHWAHHTQQAGDLSPFTGNFLSRQSWYPLPQTYDMSIPRNSHGRCNFGGPVHIAAAFGFFEALHSPTLSAGLRYTYPLRESPLHLSIFHGHTRFVEAFLSLQGTSDINSTDGRGRTPLHCALEARRDDILQLLLTVPNLNYNARDANGDTPLHIASYQGRASLVEHLLRLPGVHVNAKDGSQDMKRNSSGNSALTLAVKMDHLECAQLLLSHPELDVNEQDRYGVTALMQAASLSRLDATRLLLQHPRIDVNAKDESGNTALWRAIPKGLSSSYYEDLIELLLNRPDLEREGLERPFIKAAALYHTRVIALFIKRGFDPRTSFMKAASKGNSAAMQTMLDGSPDIDYGMHQDSRGETALFKAAANGHELATQLLLKRKVVPIGHKNHRGETALIQAAARGQDLCVGAVLEHCDHHDVNSTNNAGQTPLIVAARSGWDRVVDRLLKDERVLVGHRADTGRTALDWAISGIAKWQRPEADTTPPASPASGTQPQRSYSDTPSHSKVVSLLLDHPDIGSSLQTVEFRKHPLVAAIYNCQTDVVKALLSSSKCDPNVRDRKGQSILMKSAAQGFTDSLELLLSMPNIDVNAQDMYGATALMKAAYCNQKKSAQILLAHPGIDINLPQWNGKTALDIATMQDSVEITEALRKRGGRTGGGGSLR